MRSSGVPARAASTMQRTAARTSSSQSETVRIRVRSVLTTSMASPSPGCVPSPLAVNAAYRPLDLGVGAGIPGGPRQDDDLARLGHGTEKRTAMAGQPLGQIDDDGAQTAGGGPRPSAAPPRPNRADPPRRRTPTPGWPAPFDAAGPHRRPGRCSWPTHRAHRRRGRAAPGRPPPSAVSVAAWPATGREDPGLAGQGRPQCGGDHGRGDRPATAPGQLGRPEKLGQPVHGDEGNGGDADAPTTDRSERTRGQEPPGGHPDVIGGNDDGHRSEGLVPLGGADGRAQFLGRRPPVPHPSHRRLP